MISRKQHDSLIHIELIISSSYLMTKASKTKQNKTKRNKTKVQVTQGERENRPWNRTKQECVQLHD